MYPRIIALIPCTAGRLLLLLAILLLALVLRATNIAWELPYTIHPDEPSAANTALDMMRAGDWNPHFFEKPSLYYYALRGVFELYLRAGIAAGHYQSIADLPRTTDQFLTTPGLFIWGRWLSVILGTATVAILYAVGRRWGEGVGLAAAALLAIAPFHIRHSQYITVDAATTLMTLLALWAALRLLDQRSWQSYLLAGLAAGLAAGTKYNAGAVVLIIVLAHGMAWQSQSVRHAWLLAIAALASLAGFVAATPYAILTPESFLQGIARQQAVYAAAGAGRWPILAYLDILSTQLLGLLPALAALGGMLMAWKRRDASILLLLIFALSQIVFFLAQDRHFSRNLLLITPIIALLAAQAIRHGANWLAHRVQLWPAGAAVALGALVALGPVLDTAEQLIFYSYPYSMVRAQQYLTRQTPHGAPAAVEFHPVAVAHRPFIIPVEHVTDQSAAWYRSQGYRYLILQTDKADPAKLAALRAAAVDRVTFPGSHEGQPGPALELLDLGAGSAPLAITRQLAIFGDQLEFLGYQAGIGDLRARYTPLGAPPASILPDQVLQLNLYWRALMPLDTDYALFVHLYDADGNLIAQRDTIMRSADYPTSAWQPGELVIDMADLPIPLVSAGTYRVVIGVYHAETFARLTTNPESDSAVELIELVIE
ncbi:MAG TPA: glycosyltransferase family 39 protein [Roseiflexaceae bacterium]|nr:glycosyltransferase family 39 protein [Roseiflexaceae bacterium]